MTLTRLVVLLVLAVFVYLVFANVRRAIRNPIVKVVDEFVSPQSLPVAESEVARLLGGAKKVDARLVGPGVYELSYRNYPLWTVLIAVVAFPIGLLALLLGREKLSLVVSLTASGGGTHVRVLGRVHRELATASGRALQVSLGNPGLRAR